MSQAIKFSRKANTDFAATLRKRVNNYFKETGKTKKADSKMVLKIVVYMVGLALSYTSLLVFDSFAISLISWSFVGWFAAMVALNVCHDAIHGALSTNQKTNTLFGKAFNVLGANDYVWKYSHNMVHHSYTNVQDHDEDVDAIPFVRTSPHQKHRFYHRFQQFYAMLFYGLATISWVFIKDYVKMSKGKIGETNMPITAKLVLQMVAFKLIYYSIFLVIPLMVMPFSIGLILAGFCLMHWVEGFTIGTIFMLAHLVEDVHFPMPDDQGNIDSNWAAHQLYTTSNFAQKSQFVGFVTGGLNFQVEHHLFPDICHVHYPAISQIVEETAKEYNLPYNTQPTLFKALRSHLRFLTIMGRGSVEEQPAHS